MDLTAVTEHQRWMAALAGCEPALLEDAWTALEPKPDYHLLRPIEIGMVLLRGRIAGSGSAFPFGEATATRAAAVLDSGERGFSYLLGRKPRAAELAAIFHALLQNPARRAEIEALVITPAEQARAARLAADRATTSATRVDFSTLVRGDG